MAMKLTKEQLENMDTEEEKIRSVCNINGFWGFEADLFTQWFMERFGHYKGSYTLDWIDRFRENRQFSKMDTRSLRIYVRLLNEKLILER